MHVTKAYAAQCSLPKIWTARLALIPVSESMQAVTSPQLQGLALILVTDVIKVIETVTHMQQSVRSQLAEQW